MRSRVRLVGWFVAANSLAFLAATALGAGSHVSGAAGQIAWWCGIG